MKKNKYDLSANEQSVMDLLWGSEEGLTSVDVMEQLSDIMRNPSYAHRALNVLIERGFIEECGSVRYNKQYARKFKPAVTREQFAAGLLYERGLKMRSLRNVAMAFIDLGKQDERATKEVLDDLQKMIDDFKKTNEQ